MCFVSGDTICILHTGVETHHAHAIIYRVINVLRIWVDISQFEEFFYFPHSSDVEVYQVIYKVWQSQTHIKVTNRNQITIQGDLDFDFFGNADPKTYV